MLFLALTSNLQAQTKIKTNVGSYLLYPFHGDDFDLKVYGLEVSQLLPSGSAYFEYGLNFSRSRDELVQENRHIRLRFRKTWYKNLAEDRTPIGFFKGIYTELNLTKEKLLSSNPDRFGRTRTGLIPSIGAHMGYTFRINKFFIEPRLGFGIGIIAGELREKSNPNAWIDFSGVNNTIRALSSSHFELNLSYKF